MRFSSSTVASVAARANGTPPGSNPQLPDPCGVQAKTPPPPATNLFEAKPDAGTMEVVTPQANLGGAPPPATNISEAKPDEGTMDVVTPQANLGGAPPPASNRSDAKPDAATMDVVAPQQQTTKSPTKLDKEPQATNRIDDSSIEEASAATDDSSFQQKLQRLEMKDSGVELSDDGQDAKEVKNPAPKLSDSDADKKDHDKDARSDDEEDQNKKPKALPKSSVEKRTTRKHIWDSDSDPDDEDNQDPKSSKLGTKKRATQKYIWDSDTDPEEDKDPKSSKSGTSNKSGQDMSDTTSAYIAVLTANGDIPCDTVARANSGSSSREEKTSSSGNKKRRQSTVRSSPNKKQKSKRGNNEVDRSKDSKPNGSKPKILEPVSAEMAIKWYKQELAQKRIQAKKFQNCRRHLELSDRIAVLCSEVAKTGAARGTQYGDGANNFGYLVYRRLRPEITFSDEDKDLDPDALWSVGELLEQISGGMSLAAMERLYCQENSIVPITSWAENADDQD